MLWVVALRSPIRSYICVMVAMETFMSSPILSMSFIRSSRYDWLRVCVVPCMPSRNGIELCSMGEPSGG